MPANKRPASSPCGAPSVRNLGQVIQSPLDSKNYKAIQLTNGLKALLVSTCIHQLDEKAKSATPSNHEVLTERIKEFNKEYLCACSQDKGLNGYDKNLPGWLNQLKDYILKPDSGKTDNDSSPLLTSSDPKSKKIIRCCEEPASVCVTVGVGSFHDPEELCGLAHLVEHLVFLGSKQYPEPNKLAMTVSESEGVVNAATFPEQTQYYFSCGLEKLATCLDILVDGIINPRWEKGTVWREINAVDSEYGIKQTYDMTRIYDFIRSTAKRGHPFRKFYWGNKKSLSHPELIPRMKAWKERYYKSNYMTVCIQAPLPVNEIEKLVIQYFTDIPQAGPSCETPTQEILRYGHPFVPENFNTQYYIVPVTHTTCLMVVWCLDAKYWQAYETKPLYYVRTLINSTEEGGLIRYLQKKHWITESVNAEASCSGKDFYCKNSFGSVFTISIFLTDKGYEEKEHVLSTVFSYINFLKKKCVRKEYYVEISRTVSNAFHFQNWEEILESARVLSLALQQVKPEHVLTSQNLLTRFDFQIINDCLNQLTPQDACFLYVSKTNTSFCKGKAWACDIRYAKDEMAPTRINQLKNMNCDGFKLPDAGYFLCKEINLSDDTSCQQVSDGDQVSTDKLRIVVKKEKKSPCISTKVPVGFFSAEFISPVASGTSRIRKEILQLWNRITADNVISKVGHKYDPLTMFEISATDEGMRVIVLGPRCHLAGLMEEIVKEVFTERSPKEYGQFFNDLRLDIVKEIISETLDSEILVSDVTQFLLYPSQPSLFQIRDTLQAITCEAFCRLIRAFKTRMKINVNLEGDICIQDVMAMLTLFSNYKYNQSPTFILPERSTSLPRGISILALLGRHPAYVTSYIINFYQFGQLEGKEEKYFTLFHHLMSRRIFTQLRTIEQLGYVVRLFPLTICGAHGLYVGVVTNPSNFSSEHVDKRIDNFFKIFYGKYLSSNKIPWLEIFKRFGITGDNGEVMNSKMATEEVKKIKQFYLDYLNPRGCNFRKLTIQLTGFLPSEKINKNLQDRQNSVDVQEPDQFRPLMYMLSGNGKNSKESLAKRGIKIIEDMVEFKRTLELYPVTTNLF